MTLGERIDAVLLLMEGGPRIRDWFPLYASDWITSLRLRSVHPGARGLLMDIMSDTWQGGRPGIMPMEDYVLWATTHGYEKEPALVWLRDLSCNDRSPVRVLEHRGVTLIVVPRLVRIALEQYKLRGADHTEGTNGGSAGIDPLVDVDAVKAGNLLDALTQPSLPLEDQTKKEKKEKKEITDRPPEPRRRHENGGGRRSSGPYSEAFTRWYSGDGVDGYDGYPNKVGKATAYRHWKEQKLDARAEELIRETQRLMEERRLVRLHDPSAFIPEWPQAKTFIYGDRWEDTYIGGDLRDSLKRKEERKTRVMVYMVSRQGNQAFTDLQSAIDQAASTGGVLVRYKGQLDLWETRADADAWFKRMDKVVRELPDGTLLAESGKG